MEDHFLERQGIAYRINEHKNGRQTLVFIHGLTGSSTVWLPYERHFKDRYNIVTYDLRGHGRSRKARHYRDYNFAAFAHDLKDLLAHLKIREFILISHSFGTLVGLQYLHQYPDEVTSVIFLSPNYGIHASLRAHLFQPFFALFARIVTHLPFSEAPRGRVDYRQFPHSGDFNIRRTTADMRNTSIRVYIYCLEHAYWFNRSVWWNRIQKPTLIIHGEHDKIIPYKNAVYMAQAMPHATLVLLKNTDHVMVINDVRETEHALEDFLQEHQIENKAQDSISAVYN